MAFVHPSGVTATSVIAVAVPVARSTAVLCPSPVRRTAVRAALVIPLLNGTGRAVVKMLGLESRGGHAMVHSEAELKMLVTASQEAGVLEEQEEQMLHRVFGFAV